MQTRAQGPDDLPAVRDDGLPAGVLLQVPGRGDEHARGRAAQHRLRGRHLPLPRRQLRHHRRHQGQEGLHMGINLSGRFRGRRQGTQVRIMFMEHISNKYLFNLKER